MTRVAPIALTPHRARGQHPAEMCSVGHAFRSGRVCRHGGEARDDGDEGEEIVRLWATDRAAVTRRCSVPRLRVRKIRDFLSASAQGSRSAVAKAASFVCVEAAGSHIARANAAEEGLHERIVSVRPCA